MTTARVRPGLGIGLILLLMSTSLVTACGGSTSADDSGTAPTVASVDTRQPTATATEDADSAADARPVWRADSTNEEVDRWLDAWDECLYDHGAPRSVQGSRIPANKMVQGLKPGSPNYSKFAKAQKACASKEPEDYKDRLRRTDSKDYDDRARKFHKCLKAKNVKVLPLTGKDNPDNNPMIFSFPDDTAANSLDVAGKCEKEAFGSVK
jgi:hypothetical protein